MLVLHRSAGRLEHRIVRDLPDYLGPHDCLIVNRTKVLPARFDLRRSTGGRIEALFVESVAPDRWRCLLTGAGRLRIGEQLGAAGSPWTWTLLERGERGQCVLSVDPPDPAEIVLASIGRAPLPPYIRRDAAGDDSLAAADRDRYQTVFAERPGAVAAPTAGLHFTPELLDRIRADGVTVAGVTLHVGLGTFAPVEVDDLADHKMHSERFDLPPDTVGAVQRARESGGRIVAVGTTSVRVLETCSRHGALTPGNDQTNLLIYPPYQFQVVDALLTNFHLPGSTLLALVCAFAGREAVLAAYRIAIDEGYRFYSYGDAMLIL